MSSISPADGKSAGVKSLRCLPDTAGAVAVALAVPVALEAATTATAAPAIAESPSDKPEN